MKIPCSPIRISQLLTVTLLGASVPLACSDEAAEDTGTYFGYYRGPDRRPQQLPTPTGTQAVSAGGSGAELDDYADAGAMAGGGGSPMGAGGGSMTDGDDPGEELPGDEEPCEDGAQILLSSCGIVGCHGNNGAFGDFAVNAGALEDLVDEAPSLSSSDCGLMIDADNPGDSFLLRKMTGAFPDGASCGGTMPPAGPLDAADIECVESWLTQFAQ